MLFGILFWISFWVVLLLVIFALFFFKHRLPASPSAKFFHNLLIAHRGTRLSNTKRAELERLGIPENTLAAFKFAAERGVDGLEMDLRLTRDNQLIVFHDDTLDRLCYVDDGSSPSSLSSSDGPGLRVVDFTLAELKEKVRFRDCQRAKELGGQHLEEKIPLFSELCELNQKEFGGLKMMVEIKHTRNVDMISKLAVEHFQKYKLHNTCVIGSFDPFILYAVRKRDPNIATLLLITENLASQLLKHSNLPKPLIWLLDRIVWLWLMTWIPSFLGVAVMGVDVKLVKKKLFDPSLWFQRGYLVNCWTVNEEEDKTSLLKAGASVTTDFLFPKAV
eukprot:TRINITY_DN367_c0_g1_i3.p1 TRINITY_DN367_c0_g1~~TRINITY_DN367_c0_g1_i3.p1  ORF type:complete len:366 (+),score=96.44 TRINITY_DN367_c0_g1_i3:102-1100(+)